MTESTRKLVESLTRALECETDPNRRQGLQITRALWAGDRGALEEVIGSAHPDDVRVPPTGEVLIHYAIGIAPPSLIQAILAWGAEVNYDANDGFPALVNAIHHEDNPARRLELVRVLIDAGADLERVGINGYRPIHCAALTNDPALIRLLLEAGADPQSKTTVDDMWTAVEEAELLGAEQGAEAIRQWLAERP